MRLRVVLLVAVVMFVIPMMTLPAHADSVINFSGAGSGNVSWAGGASGVEGTDIAMLFVRATNTPMNSGISFPLTSGSLNFTTGVFDSYNGATNTYFFKPGGTFTITGFGPNGSGPILLTGTFGAGTVLTPHPSGEMELRVLSGSGPDAKDLKLLEWFGVPASTIFTWLGSVNLSGFDLSVACDPYSGFSADVDSAHADNHFKTPVTEPGMLALMGFGMVGLAAALRRGLGLRNR